jgi:Bacterial pre-peptidase C-terminal domain/PEP-CTERM motif
MTPKASFSSKALTALAALLIGGAASAEAATISKIGGNTSHLTAQNLDGFFDLTPDGNVADSLTVPHVTIGGAVGSSAFDWYRFTATAPGRLILDIDFGMPDIDTMLHVFNSAGTRIAVNDDFPTAAGGGGSSHFFDSFIDMNLSSAGTFYVVVGEYYSDWTGAPFAMSGNFPDPSDNYTLHVSLQNPIAAVSVPEPASAILLAMGLAGLAATRRRQQRA